MKTMHALAIVGATYLLSASALAANMSANGVVRSVDTGRDAITLMDGSEYTLAEGFEAEKFATGEKSHHHFYGQERQED